MTGQLPQINLEAREEFRQKAVSFGLNPDDKWIGGYVEYEWGKLKHTLDVVLDKDKVKILEFGCNIGASAVIAALCGHVVYAVDIKQKNIELANLNAAQYGVGEQIFFTLINPTDPLPYDDAFFDAIICNSVLEYVNDECLKQVLKQLDRVLKPDGKIIITGTSNRMAPKEVHKGKWFINYFPKSLGKLIYGNKKYQIGLHPFRVLRAFKGYENLDLLDNGKLYLEIKKRFGLSSLNLNILRFLKWVLRPFKISVGLLTPSFSVNLRKPK